MQAGKIKPEYSFCINDFRIDPGENTVSQGDEKRQIEPRAMQVLVVLSCLAGETVSRSTLLTEVWGDRVVVEEALTRIISQLRVAFNDSKNRKLIQTVPKKGYRLNAEVTQSSPGSMKPVAVDEAASLPSETAPEPAKADVQSDMADNPEPATVASESRQSGLQASAFSQGELKGENFRPVKPVSKTGYWAGTLLIALVTTILLYLNSGESSREEPSVTGNSTVEGAVSATREVSIAVLPLEQLSPDQDTLYLAEGLPEELLNELARVPELKVPSRYSAFALSQGEKQEDELAEALNVRYLLEGSVRRTGTEFKVVMRLVDTAEDRVIWSEGFEDSASRLYEIPGKVAVKVQQTLLPDKTVLPSSERQSGVDNVEAYQHYLQGIYWLMNGKTSEWFYRAESSFRKAVEADPGYAQAYGSLAYVYARYNYHDTFMDAGEAQSKAKRAIDKALSLEADEPNALFASAILKTSGSDFDGAEAALERVLTFLPENATALYLYSELELARNDYDEALDYALRAKQKDSLSPWVNVNLAIVHFWRGELQLALSAAENAIRIDNNYTWAYVWKAKILQHMGHTARAIKTMERCNGLDDSSPTNNAYLGLLYLELNLTGKASQWFERTAVLYGNTDDARFWQQFERFAYRRQDPDIAARLLNKLTLADNRIFSLMPVLFQLEAQTGGTGDSVFHVFADNWQQGETVNYLNQHLWLGARGLGALSVEKISAPPFSELVTYPQYQQYLYEPVYEADVVYPWLWMMDEDSLSSSTIKKRQSWQQTQTAIYESRLSE